MNTSRDEEDKGKRDRLGFQAIPNKTVFSHESRTKGGGGGKGGDGGGEGGLCFDFGLVGAPQLLFTEPGRYYEAGEATRQLITHKQRGRRAAFAQQHFLPERPLECAS